MDNIDSLVEQISDLIDQKATAVKQENLTDLNFVTSELKTVLSKQITELKEYVDQKNDNTCGIVNDTIHNYESTVQTCIDKLQELYDHVENYDPSEQIKKIVKEELETFGQVLESQVEREFTGWNLVRRIFKWKKP